MIENQDNWQDPDEWEAPRLQSQRELLAKNKAITYNVASKD